MPSWVWVAVPLTVVVLVVIDRLVAHLPVRTDPRPRKQPGRGAGGGSGAFGELIALFQPSVQHLHEEVERKRSDLVTPGAPEPGWKIDLDVGTAIAPRPDGKPPSTGESPGPAVQADPPQDHACLLEPAAHGVWTMTAQPWSSLTTLVVADDGTCLIIDPNIWPADLAALVREVTLHGWTPTAGFSTHPHWDHVLWPSAWADVTRWATPAAAAEARSRRQELRAEADEVAPGHDHRWTGLLTSLEEVELPWDGPHAVVLPYAGHCHGSAALWLPEPAVLVSGDMLSDVEIPLLADPSDETPDPLAAYRASLDLLAEVPATVLVPGHGTVTDRAGVRARLAADRAYLDLLDPMTSTGPDDEAAAVADPRLVDPEQAEHHARQVALVASRRKNG